MDRLEAELWWFRALHERLMGSLPGNHGKILDAGCGTGGLLRLLAAHAGRLAYGIERDEQAARRARLKSGAIVAVGSVESLPFPAGAFDAAILADVLCHAAVSPSLALAELSRVLRPGGRLVVNMPAYAWLLSAHDRRVHNVRRQTARQVRVMLEAAGFVSVEARYWNSLLLPLMILRRKLSFCHESASDVTQLPAWLNISLKAVTDVERRLPSRLPFGGSVLATAIRP